MKTISLEFDGYWREVNKGGIPAESGIYGVYACTYNKEQNTVSLRELVYVGESSDVNSRISNHERLSDWKKRLRVGETLCYSFAKVEGNDRLRAEAAVISITSLPATSSTNTLSHLLTQRLRLLESMPKLTIPLRYTRPNQRVKGLGSSQALFPCYWL